MTGIQAEPNPVFRRKVWVRDPLGRRRKKVSLWSSRENELERQRRMESVSSLQIGERHLSSCKRVVGGQKRLTSVLDPGRHGSWACFLRYPPVAAHAWPLLSASHVFLGLLLLSLSILLTLKRPRALTETGLREVSSLVQSHLAERQSQDGNPSWPHMLRKWDFLLKCQKKHVFLRCFLRITNVWIKDFFFLSHKKADKGKEKSRREEQARHFFLNLFKKTFRSLKAGRWMLTNVSELRKLKPCLGENNVKQG